jgi:Flp pilus assembly protein TadG
VVAPGRSLSVTEIAGKIPSTEAAETGRCPIPVLNYGGSMIGRVGATLRRQMLCHSGNVAVLTSLALLPLVAIVGTAVDYIRIEDARTRLQAALDAAVLAGAVASKGHEKQAKFQFDREVGTELGKTADASFVKSKNVRIVGKARADVAATFTGVMGFKAFPIEVTAIAETTSGTSSKLCPLLKNPTQVQELLANSGATVIADNCEIHVASSATPAAIFNPGSRIEASKICIRSQNIIKNGGTQKNIETGCETLPDPFEGKIPEPSSRVCSSLNGNYSGNVTINPGVYCGMHNFNALTNVQLNPGTYVIKSGGWNVNGGNWSGDGVTFYFADTSKIQFNSAVKATLKPPSSGPYKDILFAEKTGLSITQMVFDDSKGFDMWGVIYLPSRQVTFNSNSVNRSHKVTGVMDSVIFNDVNWTLQSYDVDAGTSGSKGARLVE